MKKLLLGLVCLLMLKIAYSQETYEMGYSKIDITVTDPHFFSEYQLPGQQAMCGLYDAASSTFYTCDYQTFRYVDEEFIQHNGKACCEKIDFDPARYYGTLTLTGTIDSVEWDNLLIHYKSDKAYMLIKTDEKEIDHLYKTFYKKGSLGKLTVKLCLKTFDKPKEDQLSYNKITERKVKPKRKQVRILKW